MFSIRTFRAGRLMDAMVTNETYTVPIADGQVARIIVQQYRNGDVGFIAAPDKGERGEHVALAAIALLKEQCELRSLMLRTLCRRHRPDGPGGREVDVPDAVIVAGWAPRFMELLQLVQEVGSLTIH